MNNTADMKSIPNRWPKSWPVLKPSDFEHDGWETSCGSKRCLVGHVRVAFKLHPNPWSGENLPKKGQEFLLFFIRSVGAETFNAPSSAKNDISAVELEASNVFEHGSVTIGIRISARRAAYHWNKARKHFGYTEIS